MVSNRRKLEGLSSLTLIISLGACAGSAPHPISTSAAVAAPSTAAVPEAPESMPVRAPVRTEEDLLYAAELKKLGDVEYEEVAASFGALAADPPPLNFDPTATPMFNEVSRGLALTEEEKKTFRKLGFVSVTRPRLGSMTGAYYRVYSLDLPVLVTTDSILDAFHRSFDEALKRIEETVLVSSTSKVLDAMHERLGAAAGSCPKELRTSLRDVDLYLTVARNLLVEVPITEGNLALHSKLQNDDQAIELIRTIGAGDMLFRYPLYGTLRDLDFSQFTPRGHYTDSARLSRFFRMMMWIGRADFGFQLPSESTRKDGDALGRDGTNASVLAWLVGETGRAESFRRSGDLIDYLAGQGDSAGPTQVLQAMKSARVTDLSELARPSSRSRLAEALQGMRAGNQRIRSQIVRAIDGPERTPNPTSFQLSGQRFAIDSFALANVVYDQIVYKNEEVKRYLPTGLDAMASLGNPEAVALLEPELRQWHYGANLLAVRRVVESYEPQAWSANVYSGWLDALRTLDDRPQGAGFPQAMQSRAWQRKQLQTQLASWAQLRHDTMLYAKQSYSNFGCSYPAGYVEPYPEFYGKMAKLARGGSKRVMALEYPDVQESTALAPVKASIAAWFDEFARTMDRLEELGRKELASTPFSQDDQDFLVRLLDGRGRGSGPPRYDGWYPKLVFDNPNDEFKPVIADIHTDPNRAEILHAAVGNTRLLVIAVDNQADRRVYVGPLFSYHEFKEHRRLHDGHWKVQLERGEPAPPEWAREFSPSGSPPAAAPRARGGDLPVGGRPPIPRPPRAPQKTLPPR